MNGLGFMVYLIYMYLCIFSANHQKTWHIIDADRYGTVPHHAKGRYYGSEFDTCHNCKQNGHVARSCSKPKVRLKINVIKLKKILITSTYIHIAALK